MNVMGLQISRVDLTPAQRWMRRALVIGAGSVLVMGGGVAYAFWTTTASGSASSTGLTLTVTANAAPSATIANQLYPGNVATAAGSTGGDLVVSVTYQKGPALKAISVVQAGPVSVDTAHATAGCTSDSGTAPNITAIGASGVYVGTSKPAVGSPPSYTSYAIPVASQPTLSAASGAQNLTLPMVLSMDTTSNTNCQGATFTVPVAVNFSS